MTFMRLCWLGAMCAAATAAQDAVTPAGYRVDTEEDPNLNDLGDEDMRSLAEGMFNRLNVDGDNTISRDEIRTALPFLTQEKHGDYQTEKRVDGFMMMLDEDGNGSGSRAEMLAFMIKMQQMDGTTDRLPQPPSSGTSKKRSAGTSKKSKRRKKKGGSAAAPDSGGAEGNAWQRARRALSAASLPQLSLLPSRFSPITRDKTWTKLLLLQSANVQRVADRCIDYTFGCVPLFDGIPRRWSYHHVGAEDEVV
eukprot:CAMPEP_0115859124 /NCGR_PEP_ID=MMETSP0287-20121206/16451_1 /TAXON_ID=412157 /ORGANISM="Chrysochromulina rotalis, Strain UIO044" /LENGTH=250 /DNA_ID=CAMNT_0003313409 /DNA_START=1 /DNA_END=752 /DNA_ORIENTATION=+